LGSGKGVSIKEIVEIIVSNLKIKPRVIWDTSKPSGDKKRLMDISRAKGIGFAPKITIAEGIKETMEWFRKNKDIIDKRYNVFK
jgi:GDP-L-fucose synthase